MGGGHHDPHKPPYEIPDYRTYKIEGVKELEAVQKHLAAKGLRDPWLRNEAWRYDLRFTREWKPAQVWQKMIFRGFKYGLAATIITIGLESAYAAYKGDDNGHGHDDHGHH